MKHLVFLAFAFLAFFFASLALAQDTTSQKLNLPQTDTTSGWQLVFSNPKSQFEFLQFPSKDTGYAVGSDLTKLILFRSVDQGTTWDSIGIPPVGKFTFISPSTGFCT